MNQEVGAPISERVADRAVRGRSTPPETAVRLEYYEKFGAVLQEQLDAVVIRGAAVTRELELVQGELRAENLRIREETQALRDEAEGLRLKVEERRAEAAAVAEETERAQSLVMDQLARLRDEIDALAQERDRRRAEVMQAAQDFARERTQLLEKLAPLREEAQKIEVERRQLRAEVEALSTEMDHARRERTALISDVAGLRAESEALGEECERRRTESAAVVETAHEEAARILSGVQETTRLVVSRAMGDLEALRVPGPHRPTGETDDGGEASATGEFITTRLITRPPLETDRLADIRGALEGLPEVLRAETAQASDGASYILVTHSLTSSLVRHLMGIHLEFRLLARGEDFLEIEVLGRDA